jgi:hypothetical protein
MKKIWAILVKIFGWIFGSNKPQPSIGGGPDEKPIPVNVELMEENGKTYKITYYSNGATTKEEVK